jgi:phosphoserine aminotransferase
MQTAQKEFCEYRGSGASVAEVSHRGGEFLEVYNRAEALLRELLCPPAHWHVLFLQGGASGQAAAIPLNLAAAGQTAAYIVTGHWSRRAADEGALFCRAHIAADTEDSQYTRLPERLDVPAKAAFAHYAVNETIHGVEFFEPPRCDAPLVADASSNILSRPFNFDNHVAVYAGAQKNLGVSGVTIVLVDSKAVCPQPQTPTILNYAKQAEQESMWNTPPTFQIYITALVLEWIKKQGGAAALEEGNIAKARALYDCLDAGFYKTPAAANCRSRMNVPFFLPSEDLTNAFLAEAEERGLVGLRGHKVLGGCRASIYNAMPMAGVAALCELLKDFRNRNG